MSMSHHLRPVLMSLVAVVNAGWSVMMILFALMAESGGKDSEPLIAVLMVWLLVEILVTAARAVSLGRVTSRLPGERHLELALMVALLCRPAVDLAVGMILPWAAACSATALVMIASCYVLRRHWRSLHRAPEPSMAES